jgi:hypothetical protein
MIWRATGEDRSKTTAKPTWLDYGNISARALRGERQELPAIGRADAGQGWTALSVSTKPPAPGQIIEEGAGRDRPAEGVLEVQQQPPATAGFGGA